MKALVLFGSESDKPIYTELISVLENDFKVDFEVISAHRDPERLEERLSKDDFDFIVAGAGLAAHLPGVCASKTKKPVFGVPVEGNLKGLDALLSIQQMPFGIPVACLGTSKWGSFKQLFDQMSTCQKTVNLIVNEDISAEDFYLKEVKRTTEYIESLDFKMTIGKFNHSNGRD